MKKLTGAVTLLAATILTFSCGDSKGPDDEGGDGGKVIPTIVLRSSAFPKMNNTSAVFEAIYEVDMDYTLKESGVYVRQSDSQDASWNSFRTPSMEEFQSKIYAEIYGFLKPGTAYDLKPYVTILYEDENGKRQEFRFEGQEIKFMTPRSGTARNIEILSARKYRIAVTGVVLDINTYSEFELLPEENFELLTVRLWINTKPSGVATSLIAIKPEHTNMYSKVGNTYKCSSVFRFSGGGNSTEWLKLTEEDVVTASYTVKVNAGGESYEIRGEDVEFNITSEL